MKRLILLSLLSIFLWLSITGNFMKVAATEKKDDVFSTWEGLEVDKCATIWLIKRFINAEASIRFFPKGAVIKEGIPFDIPDARLRRYHNMSTYESFLKHYNLKDPKLVHIGEIIHDIEINIWERKKFEETYHVQNAVNELILKIKDEEEVIKKTNRIFDAIYEKE